MLRFFCHLMAAMLLVFLSIPVSADDNRVVADLKEGRLDRAAAGLLLQLSREPQRAITHQLLCRVFYAEDLADEAIHECEAAVSGSGQDPIQASDNQMWLGRAYGMKASRANPVAAFRLAKKVGAAFERSVRINERNIAAFSDLGEFYVGAPAIVGGGLDKASALAARLMALSPAKAHRLLAMTAEKRNDVKTAEAEFKRAVETQRSPATLVDLADFYQRQKQCDKSVTTVLALDRLDRARDTTLVDAASVLTSCEREPELARQLLTSYLNSAAKSDSAPAPKVHVQLGDLLAKAGDSAGAQREYRAALALASEYYPAQEALQRQ